MKRITEGVSCILDDEGKLIAIIRKNGSVKTYLVKEVTVEQMDQLVDQMIAYGKGASKKEGIPSNFSIDAAGSDTTTVRFNGTREGSTSKATSKS